MNGDRKSNGNSVFSAVASTVILGGAFVAAALRGLKPPIIQLPFGEATPMSDNNLALVTNELKVALKDADTLLGYATKSGLLADDQGSNECKKYSPIVEAIVKASRAEQRGQLTDDIVTSFWIAYARLSKVTCPVTAESIKASEGRSLSFAMTKLTAATLVILTILFSIFLFMSNSTANDTNELIEQQNNAALELWSDVQVLNATEISSQRQHPSTELQDLTARAGAAVAERIFRETVEFSRKNDWLLQAASKLRFWFNPPRTEVSVDPVVFNETNEYGIKTLNVAPDLNTRAAVQSEVYKQIKAYQIIRDYAIGLYKNNTIFYGGIATYLLPTVYALLGAYLYEFRSYSKMISEKTYLKSQVYGARYFIAAIGGLVVGLFSSLLPKNLSLPPLAIAFLVGYAVEVLFSPLDAYIAKITGSRSSPKPDQPLPSGPR